MSVASVSLRELMVKIESLPMQQIAQVNKFVEFLQQRGSPVETTYSPKKPHSNTTLEFPVLRVGRWPEDLNLRREALYGDDAR